MDPGFYAWGGFDNGTTRTNVTLCPAAADNGGVAVYCAAGTGVKLPCMPGFYGGNFVGMSSPNCSGPCGLGVFCVAGSAAPGVPCGNESWWVPV